MSLRPADADCLIRAVELLAEHGSVARRVITDALLSDALEDWQVEEAAAQLEDA